MRLQQKVFSFITPEGKIPSEKLLTSKVSVNDIPTDKLLSELFTGIKKEKNGTIKGYSILEHLSEKGNISVNDIKYNISFISSTGEKIIIKEISDPKDYILDDKELSEDELKVLENFIQESGKSSSSEQPQDNQLEAEKSQVEDDSVKLYDNEYYNEELKELINSGYKELHTEPKSNFRLLKKEDEDDVLIEITKDDYEVREISEYKIEVLENNFTITKND